MWRRGDFRGWCAGPVDTLATFSGVARGLFAVSPDSQDVAQEGDMHVGVTHLPLGMIIAQAPHGAAGMAIADGLALNFPDIFAQWPVDGERLAERLPEVVTLIQSLGGISTIDD